MIISDRSICFLSDLVLLIGGLLLYELPEIVVMRQQIDQELMEKIVIKSRDLPIQKPQHTR